MSTESISGPSQAVAATEACRNCGAAMAPDQRYCLQCGERRAPMRSMLLGGGPPAAAPASPPPAAPQPPSGDASRWQERNNTLTVIAGVGVLMLAMGVGVLIGRSASSKPSQAPAEVITVGSGQAAAGTPTPAAESFTSDWPSGKTGFTVQLQTLPQPGTTVAAVQAAKAAAAAKGAKGVGALKSEEFSSLASGNYVVYSGDYRKRSDAQAALATLKKSFPGASVIDVSNRASGSGAAAASEGSGSSGSSGGSGLSGGVGHNLSKPAPPSVLESKPVKGQSYVQKSKSLPDVISTG